MKPLNDLRGYGNDFDFDMKALILTSNMSQMDCWLNQFSSRFSH